MNAVLSISPLSPLIMPHINWYKYRHELRLIIKQTTTTTTRIEMAERFQQSELTINAFTEAEQLILSTFERSIGDATERREQLLVQLNDMRLEYLNKEESRIKQVSDIQKLITQLMETSVQQNPIVKLKKDQVKNIEENKRITKKNSSLISWCQY